MLRPIHTVAKYALARTSEAMLRMRVYVITRMFSKPYDCLTKRIVSSILHREIIYEGVIFAANQLLYTMCFYGQNLFRPGFKGNTGEGAFFLLPFLI